MKKIILLIAALTIALPLFGKPQNYGIIKLKGAVTPVLADYISEAIDKAHEDGCSFVVIQMDTPGGLMTSMDKIIQRIMSSKIPVVVYTFPEGARAASAGGFIMLSSHIAVMAPATRIGAMHPVNILDMGGDKKKTPGKTPSELKLINDTVALSKSLAQERKRNVKWAEKAVRKAISSTSSEALKLNIIDFIATDMNDLMKKLHNRKVLVKKKNLILKTNNIKAITYEMTQKQRILNAFANPEVIFFLLIIAVVGIGIEFKSPGMIVPGAVGAISLVIFLIGIRIIPINVVGLLLIILAIILFILELQIVSYGLLTIGGLASFVIGSLILFDSPLPGGSVPIPTIITAALIILGLVFIVVRLAINAHKEKVVTGVEGLIGDSARVLNDFMGKGKVEIHGEIWRAHSNEDLKEDDTVYVLSIEEGMVLSVSKMQKTD